MPLVALILCTMLAQAEPPRPPPKPPPGPPGGAAAVRAKISEIQPSGKLEERVLRLARSYLDRSDRGSKNAFASNRDLVAADALTHAAEHQQHILKNAGPPPPPMDEIGRHLERVYFRLQQADYFVKQSADPEAVQIAKFAREYYQRAVQARDRSDASAADECAKSAEDSMRALESLAQAKAVGPPPPPPRPPGPPPPPRRP